LIRESHRFSSATRHNDTRSFPNSADSAIRCMVLVWVPCAGSCTSRTTAFSVGTAVLICIALTAGVMAPDACVPQCRMQAPLWPSGVGIRIFKTTVYYSSTPTGVLNPSEYNRTGYD
ncbi:unnamed protein product, partial [Ectocarpus sp. 12 AP-2014]